MDETGTLLGWPARLIFVATVVGTFLVLWLVVDGPVLPSLGVACGATSIAAAAYGRWRRAHARR